jgi:uncharacterized protein YraI
MLLVLAGPLLAQDSDELVASLEVLEAGVQVKRVDTAVWVPINVETLVGQGDRIRTDTTGQARITFFVDGSTAILEPGTEVHIVEYAGTEDQFRLTVEVLIGITRQQFGRLIESGSSYEVLTPGVAMTVRGTDFSVRVEDDGRSSLLTHEGMVAASASGTSADVPTDFGVRSAVDAPLSDVVPATTFEELDTALDGCAGAITTPADVKLNVRLGPGLDKEIVGTVAPANVANIIGSTEDSSWYRIPFRNGYGWVSSAGMEVTVDPTCPGGIAIYSEDKLEDPSRYGLFGETEVIGVIASQTANLRAGPGVEYARVGQLFEGDQVAIIGRNAESTWLRVRTEDGRQAWIAVFLLQVNSDVGFIGVVPAEETPEETPTPEPTAEPDETPDEATAEPGADG